MKTAKPDVVSLIYTRPLYTAIVKTVGYGLLRTKEVIDALKNEIALHGQDAVDAAARELLDYQHYGDVLYARLKQNLRVQSRQVLGPLPEEWEDFWTNADGSPREGKPKKPPVLPGPPLPKPTSFKPGPVVPLESLTRDELADRLHDARKRWSLYSPNSQIAKKVWAEVQAIEAEFRRRSETVPVQASDKAIPTAALKEAWARVQRIEDKSRKPLKVAEPKKRTKKKV